MMKKITMLVCAMLLLAFSGVAFADGYPKYYRGNSSFPLATAHMGSAQYMYTKSLKVEKNEPPIYIISVKYIRVDNADRGGDTINRWETNRFYYDIEKQQMYIEYDGKWEYMPRYGCEAEKYYLPMGEMAFKQAFNKKFYK